MTVDSLERSPFKGWAFEPAWAACGRCGWSYLVPAGIPLETCPRCFARDVTPVNDLLEPGAEDNSRIRPPEKYLPFSLSEAGLSEGIVAFSRGIPFAPADLNPTNLKSRLQRLFLPLWLVDAEVQATWQAEMGFDYQVVSHKDRYDDHRSGWVSQEVKEGRVRWEPRLGTLNRSYANVLAPALEEEARLRRALGDWDLEKAKAYDLQAIQPYLIRLPDRIPSDAWLDALPAIQSAAGEECRQAAQADHQRNFRWNPRFSAQNWTLLLRPVITTYYLDDEGVAQPVLIHGQTGKVSGQRRASLKRAQRSALLILGAALGLFLIGLVLLLVSVVVPSFLPFGGLGLLLAFLVALGAILPVFQVWQFNRSQ